jgi:hypothetical protein
MFFCLNTKEPKSQDCKINAKIISMLHRNKITCLPVFDEVNRQAVSFAIEESNPSLRRGRPQLSRGKPDF